VYVVRGREAPPAHECIAETQTLVRGCGDGKTEQRQPRERRQHVHPNEHRHRQEDEDADDERAPERAPFQRLRRREHDRTDVRGRQKRRRSPEDEHLRSERLSCGNLRDRGDRQPQDERRPEAVPVEPDRLGDELPDGPLLGRQRRRQLLRHPAPTVSEHELYDAVKLREQFTSLLDSGRSIVVRGLEYSVVLGKTTGEPVRRMFEMTGLGAIVPVVERDESATD
jgi:hypothetical protein